MTASRLRSRGLVARLALACCALAATGCASDNNGSGSSVNGSGTGHAGTSGAGTGTGGAGTGVGGTPDLNVDAGDPVSGGRAGTGGSPEVCDGIDNDNNGIIDDVDANGDGVCDCLLIATLGVKGTAGVGDVFATWLSARSNTGATSLADQVLTPELLAKYNVIVAEDVQNNHVYSDAEATALSDWVKKGGGFMSLIGYGQPTEIVNVNRLLLPFTMSYGMQQILRKPNGGSTVPITMWIPHPVDTGVMSVGIDNGYPVQGTGTTFAMGGTYEVGKAQGVAAGHVLMWGDEWITYNSEWQNHPDYQVQLFWLNAIKWLTVAGTCQVVIPPNPPK